MKKSFVAGLFTVLLCSAAGSAQMPAGWSANASSIQGDLKDLVKPENAFDGNMQTRWSSNASDPQWLQADFGAPMELCGVVVQWEAAFGKVYDIQVSNDEADWKTMYSVTDGDGGTDDVYFPKTKARYLRILGKERGTTWGYSVWELNVKGPESIPVFGSSSNMKNSGPEKILDGSQDTSWKSKAGKDEWLTVDLRASREIGGVELYWGASAAKEYEIYGASDNDWKKLFSTAKGNGGKDIVYVEKTSVRKLKIAMKNGASGGFELKEIMFKGADEAASPQKTFELAAMEAPLGAYPRWLIKQQVFFTVLGVDRDSEESLFSEDGAIEPFFHSFSIEPFLYIDEALITRDQVEISRSLEKDYLPIPSVTWKREGFVFNQQVFAAGAEGNSGNYVKYTIENISGQAMEGSLFIAFRPFQVNPPWQYGGLSEIRNIQYVGKTYPSVSINGRRALVAFARPDKFGALPVKKGEIVEAIAAGTLPDEQEVNDPDKYASGALEYKLKLSPGAKTTLYFYVPINSGSSYADIPQGASLKDYYDNLFDKTAALWDAKLSSVKIDIPEKQIVNMMKTNLAYILINRDKALLQPGSRNYQRAWMRDGAIINAAMLRSGFMEEAKEFIDFMASMVEPDGFVPFMIDVDKMPEWAKSWTEYDSQGEFIYAIMEYYRFSGDKQFVKDCLPAAKRALEYITRLRNTRMTDEYKNGPDEKRKYYGLVPPSNSHEGYFPPAYSYWDDFFTLKGWKDAVEMAKVAGDSKLERSAKHNVEDFRGTFYDSMRLVMKLHNMDTIPASADKADFDPTSTSIGLFPCDEYEYMPREQTEKTFEKYYAEGFSSKLKQGWTGGYTPYEQRNAMSFLIMGRKDKALNMVRYFCASSRPKEWNEVAEVVFGNYRMPQYVGDMPHTWISGEIINTIRSLFIYEDNGELALAKGVDKDWLRFDNSVNIGEMPTYWGSVAYSAKQEKEVLKIKVTGTCKPPKGFSFLLPEDVKVKSLTINGKVIKELPAEKVKFSKLPAEINVVLENK